MANGQKVVWNGKVWEVQFVRSLYVGLKNEYGEEKLLDAYVRIKDGQMWQEFGVWIVE